LSQIYWKWANFAILVGVLVWLLYKRAGAFFRSRSDAIRQGIEEADRLRREAEERATEIERRMSNLQAEIEGLRKSAREEMAAENERLRRETGEGIQKMREQAEQEISSAAKAARHEVRAHAAEMAVLLAAGKIRGRLTPAADDALVASFLDDLDQPDGGKTRKELN
jgi:F-type H+-transporting ATPase subunit b